MVRSALSKVAWVGRTASMVFGLALVMALVVGAASTAWSATGGSFLLGKPNVAESQTSLVGTVTNAAQSALVVVNKGTGSALKLQVTNTNSPPLKVNSQAEVANLNAQFAGHADTADSATNATNAENATNATNAENATSAQNAAGLECTGCVSAGDLGADAATQAELDSEANTRANADNVLSTQLAGKADTNHSHDDRYYTETEMNTALSGKANTTHQHSGADITSGTVAEERIASSVARDSEITTALGMQTTRATLGTGFHSYIFTPAFTPSASGKCLVTVSTQIKSVAANTSEGPYYRVAIDRGGVSTEDNVYGHYFPPTSSGNMTPSITRSSVFNVTGGQATKFGAYFGGADSNWAGDEAAVHVTYWCTAASGS